MAAVSVAAQTSDPEGTWVTASPLPIARNETASAAVDGRIYVIGGNGADQMPSTLVQVYDVAQDLWSEAAPVPLALHHAGAAVVDGKNLPHRWIRAPIRRPGPR